MTSSLSLFRNTAKFLFAGILLLTFSLSTITSYSEPTPADKDKKSLPIKNVSRTLYVLEIQPNIDIETGEIIKIHPSAMKAAKTTLKKRLKNAGVIGASFSIQENRLMVELPQIVNPAEFKTLEKTLIKTSKLTIHQAHPQTYKLASLVAEGKEVVPGYRTYPQKFINPETGKQEGVRYLLVKRRPALTGKDIALAWPARHNDTAVLIELTDTGGKKMEAFTKTLTPGKDLIVSVLDGEVINAATIRDGVLSNNFMISGLDNIKECEELANGLKNPLENDIKIIDKRVLPAPHAKATNK